jgi:hypothetical protein
VIVAVFGDPAVGGVPTDTFGNEYVLIESDETSGENISRLYYAYNVRGGTPFMVTKAVDVGGSSAMIIHEVSGVFGLGAHAKNYQVSPGTGTDAVTSTAVIPASNGHYIFGVTWKASGSGVPTITAGTGYTARETATVSTSWRGKSEDLVQSSAASIASTFTLSVDKTMQTYIATFPVIGPGDPGEWPIITSSGPGHAWG